jgi:hypothetical protein
MIFTVDYRTKDGQRTSLEIDVPDKAALWPELKKRNITAISVRAGSNPKKAQKISVKPIFLTIPLLLLVAVGLYFFMTPENSEDGIPPKEGKTQIKQQPKKSPVVNVTTNTATPSKEIVSSNNTEKIEEAPNPRRVPSTAKKYPRRIIKRRPEPPQRFKYDSDDLIAGFLEIAPGDQVEGGLRFDKIARDFEKSLSEDVALSDGQDSEENKQLQKWVRDTKREIMDVMRRENKTFAQVMEEQFDQLQELGQYKMTLEQELREIRKSGEFTDDEYDKFVQASNAMLESKGCSPLKVPKATYYQMELFRKRRAARNQNLNNQTLEGGN